MPCRRQQEWFTSIQQANDKHVCNSKGNKKIGTEDVSVLGGFDILDLVLIVVLKRGGWLQTQKEQQQMLLAKGVKYDYELAENKVRIVREKVSDHNMKEKSNYCGGVFQGQSQTSSMYHDRQGSVGGALPVQEKGG